MIKSLVKLFGVGLSVGMYLTVLLTFLVAFFSPTKCVLVCINSFGEGLLELIILPIGFVVSILGCYYVFKEVIYGKG